jgi:hypothetical protein
MAPMRPETIVPLTLEEHRELAVELCRTRARVRELCNVVVGIYGPNNPAAFTFLKVAESMDRLCNDLQAQASRDCPGNAVPNLYL